MCLCTDLIEFERMEVLLVHFKISLQIGNWFYVTEIK
jgi:hypothetical protein